MSIIDGVQSHYNLFGLQGLFLVAKARLLKRQLEIAVETQGISHPLYLRLRTSDVALFEEIIVNKEYEFEPIREPSVLVDAGANIGLTSVYFANKFPRSKIIAIEPETGNFEMLCKNAARYPNIVPVQAALWKSDTLVDLKDPGSGAWGFRADERTSDASSSAVRGVTVDTLMREHQLTHIDVLKIDIEGSEKEVFETCAPWIDQVDAIIIELHDRWKSGCSQSVYGATKDFSDTHTRGETTFLFRSQVSGKLSPRAYSTTSPNGLNVNQQRLHRIVAVQG